MSFVLILTFAFRVSSSNLLNRVRILETFCFLCSYHCHNENASMCTLLYKIDMVVTKFHPENYIVYFYDTDAVLLSTTPLVYSQHDVPTYSDN